MQKKTILVFIFLLFSTLLIQAQSKNLFVEPKELTLKNNEEDMNEQTQRFNLMTEKFYPIGWSRDGKFAYLIEPVDEACGCYFANLYIQDLRTDKILWKNQYEGKEGADENLKSHWRKNQKLFSTKLAQYGIVAGKNFKLTDSPLKVADDSVNVDFFSNVELIEDAFNSKGNVSVKLASRQKGTKTVYEQKYDGTGSNGIMEIKLGGILLSPFETRTVVILVHTVRGWEGPPHITRLEIVGASLKEGYKK